MCLAIRSAYLTASISSAVNACTVRAFVSTSDAVAAFSRADSKAMRERAREDFCAMMEAADSSGTDATTSSVALGLILRTCLAHRQMVMNCWRMLVMLSVWRLILTTRKYG